MLIFFFLAKKNEDVYNLNQYKKSPKLTETNINLTLKKKTNGGIYTKIQFLKDD